MASFPCHEAGTQSRLESSGPPSVAAGRQQAAQEDKGGSTGGDFLLLWPALEEGSRR